MNAEAAIFNVLRRIAGSKTMAPALDWALSPFNPFAPERYIDPYPIYEKVRSHGPAYRHRMAQMWVVTGYEEAEQVLRGPVSVDRVDMVEGLSPYREMRAETSDLMLSNMLMQDPPTHTRLRRMVNRGFTPRSVARMSESTERAVATLVDGLRAGPSDAPVDIVAAMTRKLPIHMICELLGIPQELRPEMVSIADVLGQFADPITGFDPREMDATAERLSNIVDDLIAARAEQPGEDIVSTLVLPDANGDVLSTGEIASMVALLMIAGQETSSGLLANALVALADAPDQRTKLADPSLVDNAVEEFLRFDSPVQATDRTVLEDFEIGEGQRLRRGQIVVVCLGAANRDPRRYDRPSELILDRVDPRPLSFGHGPHHCVGAALARLQARTALPAFVNAFPHYRLEPSGIVWKRSTTLRGPQRLTLRLGGTEYC